MINESLPRRYKASSYRLESGSSLSNSISSVTWSSCDISQPGLSGAVGPKLDVVTDVANGSLFLNA